ncbi:FUSC family protein [Streptomyces sp. NPDC006172]|uniref:FUSC family protein n=1 Tax=Streptomyces sp. NPDC006172 TaxID=3154470 RepID=UPI0033EEE0D1
MSTRPALRRVARAEVLRCARPSDIWFKPALSVLAATALPALSMLVLGRLDLAVYPIAGAMSALYCHNRPYAARYRPLAYVLLGMVGGLAVALLTAAATTDAVVLVGVGALMAALQKAVCDATRIGPPASVVLTFISSTALFLPQTPAQVPGHVGLALLGGLWAWLVCMAPGLLRPHGPERRATAHALDTVAAYVAVSGRAEVQVKARAAAGAAVQAAWQCMAAAGARGDLTRRSLMRLVACAEVVVTAPGDADPGRLQAWARMLRGSGPVPYVGQSVPDGEDFLDVVAETTASPRAAWWSRHSLLAPIAVRTGIGCALAGYASLALGIGRPYWALVTAASLYQANLTLTRRRAVERVVGNLLGVLAFAATVPLAHLHPAALVLCFLAFCFAAAALIGPNYWLHTVCVTPMALLITEFARTQDSVQLISGRITDTLVGTLVGFAAALAVTNRRAGDRLEHALTAVEHAQEHAAALLAEPDPVPSALNAAGRRLGAALVELRASADTAAGEWGQRALPGDRVVHAEQSGHQTLAEALRRQRPASLGQDAGTTGQNIRA